MAKQIINIGTVANDGTGSNLRSGGLIINDNFNEIYNAIGNGTSITLTATPTELNLLSGQTSLVTATSSTALTNKNLSSLTNTFPTINIRDDASSSISLSLGGTLKFKSNDGITTTVSQGDTITISLDSNVLTETSSDVLTNKTIAAASNTITGLTNTNLSGSAGITNANIANSFIRISDESSTQGTIPLGGRIEFTAGEAINTTIENGNRVLIAAEDATSSNKGVATFNTASFTVTSGDVTIKSAGVSNAQLANSTITLGSTSTSLGGTTTSVAGLSLTGSANTIDLTSSGNKLKFNYVNFAGLPNSTTYAGMFATTTGTAKAYFADSGSWNEILSENSSIKDLSDVAATNPTNGQILVFNSTSGRYEPGTPAGGGTVTSITAGTGLSGGTITSSGTISLTNTSFSIRDDSSSAISIELGGTLKFKSNDGITTTVSQGDTITIGLDSNVVTETSSDTLTNKTINSNNNTITNIKSEDFVDKVLQTSASIDVTNSGLSAYLFNSHYSGNNPTLYLRAGHTYALNLNVSGHPFHLQTVSGGYSSGNPYTSGLTHVATNGTVTTGASALLQVAGTLYIEVPSGSSSTIYYACQFHSGMAGKIVLGPITDTFTGDGSTINFTINSGRNVNDVLAIVNGIILVPTTDYTISGTTITFQVAPSASAEIQVRYL